jgi:hypothetical protein
MPTSTPTAKRRTCPAISHCPPPANTTESSGGCDEHRRGAGLRARRARSKPLPTGPCWEHDGCRLVAEAAETLTALRDTIADRREPFAGKTVDAWLP